MNALQVQNIADLFSQQPIDPGNIYLPGSPRNPQWTDRIFKAGTQLVNTIDGIPDAGGFVSITNPSSWDSNVWYRRGADGYTSTGIIDRNQLPAGEIFTRFEGFSDDQRYLFLLYGWNNPDNLPEVVLDDIVVSPTDRRDPNYYSTSSIEYYPGVFYIFEHYPPGVNLNEIYLPPGARYDEQSDGSVIIGYPTPVSDDAGGNDGNPKPDPSSTGIP